MEHNRPSANAIMSDVVPSARKRLTMDDKHSEKSTLPFVLSEKEPTTSKDRDQSDLEEDTHSDPLLTPRKPE